MIWEHKVKTVAMEATDDEDHDDLQWKQCLNFFGQYGWEVIQVLGIGSNKYRILMKRRKQQ